MHIWCVENQEVVDDISSLVWYVWYSRVHTIWYGMVRVWMSCVCWMQGRGKYHWPCWTSKTPLPRSFQNLNENSTSRDGQIKHQSLHLFSAKDVNGQPWGRITMHHQRVAGGKFWVCRRWSDVDWGDKGDPFEASPVCARAATFC